MPNQYSVAGRSRHRGKGGQVCSCRGGARPGRACPRSLMMAFAVAACSDTPKPESELGQGGRQSPATPGSARDFAVNVGDIVYFTTDSVDLSPEAHADAHQSGALAAAVFAVHHHHRGPRRRARHPRVQHRARREARHRRCAPSWPSTASMPSASARSPTARSARWRCATTSPAGRRIAAPRPCSTAATKLGLSPDSSATKVWPQCRRSLAARQGNAERGARSDVLPKAVGRPRRGRVWHCCI